jgi:HEAT repeat protein
VRELAAALLGESGDQGAAPQLATALRSLVNEAEGDLALEGVAATALRALARLGGPDAVGAAVTMAGDTRHPYRGAAIEALGTLCDPVAGRAHAARAGDRAGASLAVARAERRNGTAAGGSRPHARPRGVRGSCGPLAQPQAAVERGS